MESGEEKAVPISHSINSSTPPGVYENSIEIGGVLKKVKIIVQSHIEIDIFPTQFYCVGTEPGKTHTAELTLTNLGNLPFQIPEVKHIATIDMDLLCRAFGIALRKNLANGYESVLNHISENIQENLPDWSNASISECKTSVNPGEKIVLNVSVTLPKNCNPDRDYVSTMRFWNQEIKFNIKSESTPKTTLKTKTTTKNGKIK